MKAWTRWLFVFPATVAMCHLASACSKEKSEPTKTHAAAPAAKEAAQSDSDVIAKLTKADEKDGTADKVVSKCAGCALHMDGDPQFTISISGFTMQFCSEDCKEAFEKDTAKKVLAMKID